jgi:hypothetical protein
MSQEKKKFKSFKDFREISKFDRPVFEFLLSYRKEVLTMRFLGKNEFQLNDEDIMSSYSLLGSKVRASLGDDMEDEYYKEFDTFEEELKDRGEDVMELIYNLIHAEGIKVLEEYKQFQQKWIDKINKNN